jgi:DNA polymerase I-like protein with 3'-5' exonuclease and polymerase domains
MLSADFRQIELRLMAHLAADKDLLRLLSDPANDPFISLAAEVCGKAPAQVTPDERGRVKQICYGLLYGMGMQSLSKKLGTDVNTAQAWRDQFLGKYPRVRSSRSSLIPVDVAQA